MMCFQGTSLFHALLGIGKRGGLLDVHCSSSASTAVCFVAMPALMRARPKLLLRQSMCSYLGWTKSVQVLPQIETR